MRLINWNESSAQVVFWLVQTHGPFAGLFFGQEEVFTRFSTLIHRTGWQQREVGAMLGFNRAQLMHLVKHGSQSESTLLVIEALMRWPQPVARLLCERALRLYAKDPVTVGILQRFQAKLAAP